MGNSFHILSKSPHTKQIFHLRVSENQPVAADEGCPELAVASKAGKGSGLVLMRRFSH
jgi:hypothetical protein